MSLVNFQIRKTELNVLTDTASYRMGSDKIGRTSKLFLLPHANMAFALRGPLEIGYNLYHAFLSSGLPTFSEIIAETGELFHAAHSLYTADHDGIDLAADESDAHLYMFGYSNTRAGMRCTLFDSTKGFQGEDFPRSIGYAPPIKPELDKQLAARFGNSKKPDVLLKIAQAQHQTFRELGLGGIGGDLILTTLKRTGITTRKAGELEALAFTKKNFEGEQNEPKVQRDGLEAAVV